MLRSMTGIACITKNIPLHTTGNQTQMSLFIMIKSLNHRYFDFSLKAPSLFSIFEIDLYMELKRLLLRGSISVTIKIENLEQIKTPIKVAKENVKEYILFLQELQKELQTKEPITIHHILQYEHAKVEKEIDLNSDFKHSFVQAIEETALLLQETQKKEGAVILLDFETRLQTIKTLFSFILKQNELFEQQQKEQLHTIIHELEEAYKKNENNQQNNEFSADPHMLILETKRSQLISKIEKNNVHEEITRFTLHKKELYKILESTDVIKGKKIDFMLQELLREIHTISAKVACHEISKKALLIKSEIESLKEQIQNII